MDTKEAVSDLIKRQGNVIRLAVGQEVDAMLDDMLLWQRLAELGEVPG